MFACGVHLVVVTVAAAATEQEAGVEQEVGVGQGAVIE